MTDGVDMAREVIRAGRAALGWSGHPPASCGRCVKPFNVPEHCRRT